MCVTLSPHCEAALGFDQLCVEGLVTDLGYNPGDDLERLGARNNLPSAQQRPIWNENTESSMSTATWFHCIQMEKGEEGNPARASDVSVLWPPQP